MKIKLIFLKDNFCSLEITDRYRVFFLVCLKVKVQSSGTKYKVAEEERINQAFVGF